MALKKRIQARWNALPQSVRVDIAGIFLRSLPAVIGSVAVPPTIVAIEAMRGHEVNWTMPVAIMVGGPLLAALFGSIFVIIASKTRKVYTWL